MQIDKLNINDDNSIKLSKLPSNYSHLDNNGERNLENKRSLKS